MNSYRHLDSYKTVLGGYIIYLFLCFKSMSLEQLHKKELGKWQVEEQKQLNETFLASCDLLRLTISTRFGCNYLPK